MGMIAQNIKNLAKLVYYVFQSYPGGSFTFDRVVILATPYLWHISDAIQDALRPLVEVKAISCFDFERDNELYIVLCPQFFGRLPKKRIVYNFEQPSFRKYFAYHHRAMFVRSIGTLDYSFGAVMRYLPGLKKYIEVHPSASIRPLVIEGGSAEDKEYDLVFFGQLNARRERMIERLREDFSILVVTNMLGEALERSLSKARACVNLHLLDASPFESTRFFQCLNLHVPMISELSIDQDKYYQFSDALKFIDMSSSNDMGQMVSSALSSLRKTPIDFSGLRMSSHAEFASNLIVALKRFGVDVELGFYSDTN